MVERPSVARKVAGSSPVSHPFIFTKGKNKSSCEALA